MTRRMPECDLCGSVNGVKRYEKLGDLVFVLACISCALKLRVARVH